ncbi:MAG TPA: tetratricopeptide repeat protein, partial [Candidatus Bathyarchaeia archaeon]|nr:tetratricopeptide repeat protein [Candidatus Bathyarchaeia archaeon]
QKQYDKAIKQFEAVLTLQPRNTDIMFLLGALYLETGNEDRAVDLFSRTIKLAPDHDSGLNSLGYIYAERGENLDEAQSLIERALKIDPDNGAYLDSLGWVYFKKDQYQMALDYLYQAEKKLTDPVIFEHLGDVYWKMKNQEQAKLYWEKSLELLPGQQKILDKIQQIPGPASTETNVE